MDDERSAGGVEDQHITPTIYATTTTTPQARGPVRSVYGHSLAGDLQAVQAALSSEPRLADRPNSKGFTPLVLAALGGYIDVSDWLAMLGKLEDWCQSERPIDIEDVSADVARAWCCHLSLGQVVEYLVRYFHANIDHQVSAPASIIIIIITIIMTTIIIIIITIVITILIIPTIIITTTTTIIPLPPLPPPLARPRTAARPSSARPTSGARAWWTFWLRSTPTVTWRTRRDSGQRM
jgi:hypothetical protein